ncbi:MAG: ABC transporter ATP-binding protein, partial [Clostridia bacterium]|nr:ABC transporter ATP-binding protein [Clostridia bacterium]
MSENNAKPVQHMGGRGPAVPRVKGGGAKNPMKTLKRLLSYAFSRYKVAAAFVVLFVLLSAGTTAIGASFFAPIVTELVNGIPNGMKPIYTNIIIIGCVYVAGALSSFAYNRIMMYIAQGTLKKMRDEMFAKMQSLPLKYFDTHTHGDLMSLYT